MNNNNSQKATELARSVVNYTDIAIEASVIEYISKKTGVVFSYNEGFDCYVGNADNKLIDFFEKQKFPVDLEFIIEFFEALLDKKNVIENGIVFTPEYIAKYIFNAASKNFTYENPPKVIDPGCGCGIFLSTAAIAIHEETNYSFKTIFAKSIYGIELDADNYRRCLIVLNLLPLLFGESNESLKLNIRCLDSLKTCWTKEFEVDCFDFIIGNPPYVNTHDMSKETARFLKKTFITTKTGVYNIFYAFIEHGISFLSEDGVLSFIVPNNFLTIKSAMTLRKFLMERRSIRSIIDFADNMVFKPVRTYNCIIQLTKSKNELFAFCVMDKTDNIDNMLNDIEFDTMPVDSLDANGWKLVDKETRLNIQKIEGQPISIKGFIRTGIATLRDNVYIVEKDNEGYYKQLDGIEYRLEDDIVRRLYKIPELKEDQRLQDICRYIIFPYIKNDVGFQIIPEEILSQKYPNTYAYLKAQKPTLDERDKGKPNPVSWFAYGRTQGLNKYGIKLLFPTFANQPKFILVDDEFALFCNGYAVFENDYVELTLLKRILNSAIMQYYVRNTSYAIEGGYYCYQKKYIEKFSLPIFDDEEKRMMEGLSDSELDEYLINRYDLSFNGSF